MCFRFASDQSNPQFSDPKAANYTTVEASNGAILDVRFDPKGNVRPWDRTLFIKVVRGFLSEGDEIMIRFGVTEFGSPGMRLQTFCEQTFEFRVLADPIATYQFSAAAGAADHQHRCRRAGTLHRGVADLAAAGRAVFAQAQGRGQMGQSVRPVQRAR